MAKIVLLISGSRHYTRYYVFAKHVDKLIKNFSKKDLIIIEGGARGIDYLAYLYAKRRKIKHLTFPADWDNRGKGAGYYRNVEMMVEATHAIAFWDGISKGTSHVVENAHRYEVSLKTIRIETENPHGKKRRGNGDWRKNDGGSLPR